MIICVRYVGKTEIQSIDFLSFAATYPTFFSAKKVAKKLESGMRSFSSILRPDRIGDFYRTTSRYPSLSSIQSFSYAVFRLKKKYIRFFSPVAYYSDKV